MSLLANIPFINGIFISMPEFGLALRRDFLKKNKIVPKYHFLSPSTPAWPAYKHSASCTPPHFGAAVPEHTGFLAAELHTSDCPGPRCFRLSHTEVKKITTLKVYGFCPGMNRNHCICDKNCRGVREEVTREIFLL